MKKAVFFILFTFAASHLAGQQSGLSITGGIGTYELSDLKTYHNELLTRLPLEAGAFTYFPPFTNIRINLYRQELSGLKYGLVYAFSATGAHANYTDYSGYLNLDQEIAAYQFGASAGYRLLNVDFFITQFVISAYGDLRLSYTRDKVMMNINTRHYYENNKLILNAFSPGAELGLEALFNVNTISVGVEGGYYFDAGTKFNAGEQSNPESYVSLLPPGELNTDMSGVRIGLKVVKRFSLELFAE
ncbi:MAG: hypothetical protein WD577_12570 [Bacteroidales bacterium]